MKSKKRKLIKLRSQKIKHGIVTDFDSQFLSKKIIEESIKLKFLALNETGFSLLKNTTQNLFTFTICNLSCHCKLYNIFNKISNLFFAHEKIKNWTQTFFFTVLAQLPKPVQN